MNNQMIEPVSLRCTDGDIALVIQDTPGCEQNIGKVVCVKGPAWTINRSGMQGWRIKPLHPALWVVEDDRGVIDHEMVEWNSNVFHEDEWLLPLRPQSADAVWWEVQQEINLYLIDSGHVVAGLANGVD